MVNATDGALEVNDRSGNGEGPRGRRPGGRTARVREAVFNATLDILAANGYQSLNIDAVADASGVNKTTIYRNWPTKAKLIQAAAAEKSAAVIDVRSTGDLERDLNRLLSSVAAHITSPVGRALVIALVESHDAHVKLAQQEFWRVRFAAARAVFTADMEFEISVKQADEVIERLIAPLFFRVFITGGSIGPSFIRRCSRLAAELAWSNLKPPE